MEYLQETRIGAKYSRMAPVASTRGLYEHLHEFLRKYPIYSSLSPLRGVKEKQ